VDILALLGDVEICLEVLLNDIEPGHTLKFLDRVGQQIRLGQSFLDSDPPKRSLCQISQRRDPALRILLQHLG